MLRSETPTAASNLYQSQWWARLEAITRDAVKRETVTAEPGRFRRELVRDRGSRFDGRWPLFLTKSVRVLAHSLGIVP